MEPPMSAICTPLLEHVLSRLKGVRKAWKEGGWIACCPAHEDRHPSLSISLGQQGQILLYCHAGCLVEGILAALGMTWADLFPASFISTNARQTCQGLSLQAFAQAKQLPWDFLANHGVVERPDGGLRLTYYQRDGTPAARHRLRSALVAREGSWWTKGAGAIVAYGLESLEAARQKRWLVLVEGETDRLTLLLHGYPALGIPGAEMVRTTLQAEYLEGIERLSIMQEPDEAGQHFVEAITALLQVWQWKGCAWAVHLDGAKDANALHIHYPERFEAAFQQAVDHASLVYGVLPDARDHMSSIWTLPALLAETIPEPQWLIPDLLSEGMFLLAGKPKQGKSWLALNIAFATASGGLVFAKYQARQRSVLYLVLEASRPQLQAQSKRLLSVLSAIPETLAFAFAWPQLEQGGLLQLEAYIQAHPHLGLIVVDSLARVVPHMKGQMHTGDEGPGEALTLLKRLAGTYHLTILVIHHLNETAFYHVRKEMGQPTGSVEDATGIFLLVRGTEEIPSWLWLAHQEMRIRHFSLVLDQKTGWWIEVDQNEEQAEKMPDLKVQVYGRSSRGGPPRRVRDQTKST